MDPYITLTPFGDHKSYALDEFIEGLSRLNPKPARKVMCADIDTKFMQRLLDTDLDILWSMEVFSSISGLERICTAREMLRRYFIYSPYEWALWLDSDIVPPPETPQILMDEAIKNNVILVSNDYKASDGSDTMWQGSGIMFMHKMACTGSRFWVADFGGKHLSEDLVFLSILDQGRYFIKMYIGKDTRVIGNYVKVNHILDLERIRIQRGEQPSGHQP